MAAPVPSSRIGEVIGERYRIESLLGQGGMGVLYVAEHLFTQRKVALKLLHPARDELPALRARFVSEARTAAATRHPHIVDVLDMGLSGDGSPYLVMELLEGVSLDRLLAEEGRLSPPRALAYLFPILGALAALHDAGIVHRDVKPSNIFLSRDARGVVCPKLLDFGLARVVSDLRLTRSGIVIGTPMYMAPEHAAGDAVTSQSDVWSLGVVLYEAIAGEPPFASRDSQAVAAQVLAAKTRPLRQVCPPVPPPLAEAIDRALRGSLDLRYRNMRLMAASLVASAVASQVPLPEDPDPLGLPEYRAWVERAMHSAATQELEGPPRVSEPAARLAQTTSIGEAAVQTRASWRAARVIALSMILGACIAIAWWVMRGDAASPIVTPAGAHAPSARSTPSQREKGSPSPVSSIGAAPRAGPSAVDSTTGEGMRIGAPDAAAPLPPIPRQAIPEKPGAVKRPAESARLAAPRPRKPVVPRSQGAVAPAPLPAPTPQRPLPRSQGGVEIEDEWQ